MKPPEHAAVPVDAEDLWERDPVIGSFRVAPIDYLNELESALEALPPGPLRAGRTFFFELDRRAEHALAPVTLSPAELAAHRSALNGALGALVRRYESRFHGDGTPAPTSGALRQDIAHFSTLIARLARAAFPIRSRTPAARIPDESTSRSAASPPSPSRRPAPAQPAIPPALEVDLPALALAFERFANGELRLYLPGCGVWTTQPSSGFYVYFAELAFAALELDLDRDLWEPLLPTLVGTQRLFADLYRPDPTVVPTPDQADYHPRWYRPERRWSEARKAALRAELSDLTVPALDALTTEHARRIFPGHGTVGK